MNKVLYAAAVLAAAIILPFPAHAAESVTVVSEPFSDAPEDHIPAELLIDNGKRYRLLSYETEDVSETGRSAEGSSAVEYEGIPFSGIPETAEISVADPVTGEMVECEGILLDYTVTGEHWSDEFRFDITVHEYDADYYMLGEKRILLDEDEPLRGYEKDLLGLIDVDAENYRIGSVSWKGEPYLSGNGILCRDLTAQGEMRTIDCSATYTGTADLPDIKAFRTVSVYEEVEQAETIEAEPYPEETAAESDDATVPAESTDETGTGILSAIRSSWFNGSGRARLRTTKVGRIIAGTVDWILKTDGSAAISLGALSLLFAGSFVVVGTAIGKRMPYRNMRGNRLSRKNK